MLSLLKRLFAPRKAAPSRPTRKVLREELESLASARGLPAPDMASLTTHKALAGAVEALRTAPAAVVAEAAGTEVPNAGTLHDAPPPLPQTAHDIARAARAEALAAGATEAQANQDAVQALSDFKNPRTSTPTRPTMPSPAFKAEDRSKPAYVPTAKRSLTVQEAEALAPPKPSPAPSSPWGSAAWAAEWTAFVQGMPPPAFQNAAAKFPDFAIDSRTAQAVLRWEESRKAVVARLQS